MKNQLLLQIKEEGETEWATLNRAYNDGKKKGEAELVERQRHWRATVYPNATFRIVEG